MRAAVLAGTVVVAFAALSPMFPSRLSAMIPARSAAPTMSGRIAAAGAGMGMRAG